MSQDYDKWAQPSLKEELAKRGLATSGTNPELVERLREWDAANADDDLLGGDPPTPPVAPPAPYAVQAPPAAPATPEPEQEKPRVFHAKYEVRGELSTSMNEDNRYRAYQEAIDAGHAPRGGLAGVCRIRMERGPAGTQLAVYEVLLAR